FDLARSLIALSLLFFPHFLPFPFFFFFFHSYLPLRVLHSFPTRRSSDLLFFSRVSLPRLTCFQNTLLSSLQKITLAHGFRPPNSDRKSTRLNSSHVAISYAVFCLKKKKKKTTLSIKLHTTNNFYVSISNL